MVPSLNFIYMGSASTLKSARPTDPTTRTFWRDILPNITTTCLSFPTVNSQLVVGISAAKKTVITRSGESRSGTAEEHAAYWTLSFFTNNTLTDGIIIDEFIVNPPDVRMRCPVMTAERQARASIRNALHANVFGGIFEDPRQP